MDNELNQHFINQVKKCKNKKIIFWGASIFLEEFLEKYPLDKSNILGIVDKNPQRWGEFLGKYEIFNPEKINELKPNCIIISIKNLDFKRNAEICKSIKEQFPKIKLLPNVLVKKSLKNNLIKYYWLFKFIDIFIPKNKKKIVFLSYPDYTDNSKEYYEYLKNHHNNEYELIWLYENYTVFNTSNVENKYFIGTLIGIWHLLTSKYIVFTHTRAASDAFHKKRHVFLQLWHGMPLKTLGFNEKNINAFHFEKYKEYGQNAYFFVSSDIFKLSMISCFLMKPDQVFITGQAKTDCILTDRNREKIEKLIEPQKYDKVIIYAPTYKEALRNNRRDIDKSFENIFYCDDFDEQNFCKILEEKNILFLIKPHPFDERFYRKHIKSGNLNHPNIKVFFDNDMKTNNLYFYDFFKFADLMISDFSSIAIDWLISKKPVIFLNSTSEEYAKKRGFILEDNYETLMPGAKVSSYKALLDAINDTFTVDSWKEKRLNTLPLLYKYFDNNSSERIYEIMKNL